MHFLSEGAMRRPGYRYTACGVGYPENARPYIQTWHIDGPVLRLRDGSLHWLTLWERINVWFGRDDAMTLEARHRPDLIHLDDDADNVPCMCCGGPIGADPVFLGDDSACRLCGEAEIIAQHRDWLGK